MPQQQSYPERADLDRLHAATCLSMTQFINGCHYPELAHLIVQQFSLLVAHPELEQVSTRSEMYRQLLEHWQKMTVYLLEQQGVHEDSLKSR